MIGLGYASYWSTEEGVSPGSVSVEPLSGRILETTIVIMASPMRQIFEVLDPIKRMNWNLNIVLAFGNSVLWGYCLLWLYDKIKRVKAKNRE